MSRKSALLLGILFLIALLFLLRNKIILTYYYAKVRPSTKVEKLPLPALKDSLQAELTAYLKTHFQRPEEYIVNTFKDHDIVFVGEMHRVRSDVQFIQGLIPVLYQRGIYNLGIEFACKRDQPMIDSLLRAPLYDPSVTNRILFNHLVNWSYQEYADLFRTAWEVNHNLPDSAKKFRIVGLDAYSDWHYVQKWADLNNPRVMAKVHAEGNGDEVMGETILQQFVAKGQKALIYCGLHHAFTKYRQPRFNIYRRQFNGFVPPRAGNIVYRAIGDRAFAVALHQPWVSSNGYSAPPVYPVDGVIDALMQKLGPNFYPVAFDTRGTPFGKLRATTTLYKYGHPNFTLADFCDGYIFLKPFSQFRSVRHIQGFINQNNVGLARQQVSNPNLKRSFLWKILSPATIDSMMYSDANIEYRMRRFW